MRARENAEVPPTPVAVAVTRELMGTTWLGTKVKEAFPLALVVRLFI
jgi:hypothetical protein